MILIRVSGDGYWVSRNISREQGKNETRGTIGKTEKFF